MFVVTNFSQQNLLKICYVLGDMCYVNNIFQPPEFIV
jgi:hypothetical protein